MGTNGSTMLEPLRQGLPSLDPAAVSSAASCALPTRYEAVREARRFTRNMLDQWELSDRFDEVCLVVSELVGSTNGIGYRLMYDQRQFDLPDMWAGIVLLGVLGYVLNTVLLAVERRALNWQQTSPAERKG